MRINRGNRSDTDSEIGNRSVNTSSFYEKPKAPTEREWEGPQGVQSQDMVYKHSHDILYTCPQDFLYTLRYKFPPGKEGAMPWKEFGVKDVMRMNTSGRKQSGSWISSLRSDEDGGAAIND